MIDFDEEREKHMLTKVDTYLDVPEFKEECEKRGKMHELLSFEMIGNGYVLFRREIYHEDPAFAADDGALVVNDKFDIKQLYAWFADVNDKYPALYTAFNKYFTNRYDKGDLLQYLATQVKLA